MKSDVRWKVVGVVGHELEAKLQQLTDDEYEIVSIDRSGAQWTIIAQRAGHQSTKGKAIGFRAPEKKSVEE